MNPLSHLFLDPPDLSDQAATEMLDFLYAFTMAFECQYASQLRRYYQEIEQPQLNLVVNHNDEFPDF
jgi:hypothetical protein